MKEREIERRGRKGTEEEHALLGMRMRLISVYTMHKRFTRAHSTTVSWLFDTFVRRATGDFPSAEVMAISTHHSASVDYIMNRAQSMVSSVGHCNIADCAWHGAIENWTMNVSRFTSILIVGRSTIRIFNVGIFFVFIHLFQDSINMEPGNSHVIVHYFTPSCIVYSRALWVANS